MILIADSGSTKTVWQTVDRNGKRVEKCRTGGINPYLQSPTAIFGTLTKEYTISKGSFDAIHFYGAGCANSIKNKEIRDVFSGFFSATEISVNSDLLGAARSLCGEEAGIVAVLGTGSNSGYYNGREIAKQIPPLGYILGDEGGGAVLGRRLLSDILKQHLPEEICSLFFEKHRMTSHEILENVYHKPFPNRFMAKFSYFIAENIQHQSIKNMLTSCFDDFFERNILKYSESRQLPVNFTGGIAWRFKTVLEQRARIKGLTPGAFSESPIEGLVRFHLSAL